MNIKYRDDLSDNIKSLFENTKSHICMENFEILEAGEGYLLTRTKVTEASRNPYGVLHGGAIFTMMDSCAGGAASTLGHKVLTLNSSINFISAIPDGYLYAEPKIVHNGRSTVVVEVRAFDENNKTIATGSFTMFNLGPIPNLNEEQ